MNWENLSFNHLVVLGQVARGLLGETPRVQNAEGHWVVMIKEEDAMTIGKILNDIFNTLMDTGFWKK